MKAVYQKTNMTYYLFHIPSLYRVTYYACEVGWKPDLPISLKDFIFRQFIVIEMKIEFYWR